MLEQRNGQEGHRVHDGCMLVALGRQRGLERVETVRKKIMYCCRALLLYESWVCTSRGLAFGRRSAS